MIYKDLLSRITESSKNILGKNLVGIYLHGSATMGCFNPKKSDLDLILIVEEDVSDAIKIEFMKKIVELNADSPAHFTMINKCGNTLFGEQIDEIFGIVPRENYVDSIWSDIEDACEDIVENAMYITLNLCRVLAYLKENIVLSKKTGGEWGMNNLPEKYGALIKEALHSYETDKEMVFDEKIALEFADYMVSEIQKSKDENHLEQIMNYLEVKDRMRILDLGTVTGYLAFPFAMKYPEAEVIGLDIVEKALAENRKIAEVEGLSNLHFVNYEGMRFPFDNNSFDIVITRYSLHHFPAIEDVLGEVSRVLKDNGIFFLSDPAPNDGDVSRFVDEYMQMKKDGHIQFYTKQEWQKLGNAVGLNYVDGFETAIRFPRKRETSLEFDDIVKRHDEAIIKGYGVEIIDDEIWITEKVNNLLFQKEMCLVRINKAEEKDLKEILELQYLAYQSEAKLFNDSDIPPLKQTLEDVLHDFQKGIILKVEDEKNVIIGSVRAYSENDRVYIGKLIVHPSKQRKGIGTKLLLAIEKEYPNQIYELFTSTRSLDNIRLYERLGYKIFKETEVTEELHFIFLEK